MNTKNVIEISGAGPAGIAAALAVNRAGQKAVVYEQRPEVGGRFHGDFQGLESWTSSTDVLDELSNLGIDCTFGHVPVREAVFFGPDGRERAYRSSQPVLYLVRRGKDSGTLDVSLKEQAPSRGVEIRFGRRRAHLPEGGVVAQGPHAPNVIASGYMFETDAADGVYGALSDELAPKGYAYLLIHGGRATIASCSFDDFHREKVFVVRTIDFFQRKVGFGMKNEQRFGGMGNFSLPETARRERFLFAGEAAGFQDALWGFGMRYAMLSGQLAGRALAAGAAGDYEPSWKMRFGGLVRASVANRYLYERLGSWGYRRLLGQLDAASDVRARLRRHYNHAIWKEWLIPAALRSLKHRQEALCRKEGCDCTWCRCGHSRPTDEAFAERPGKGAA